MFNSDVDILRLIGEVLDVLYMKEEEDLAEGAGILYTWMQFAAEAPAINNYDVLDALDPSMDPNISWVHTQRTPDVLLD